MRSIVFVCVFLLCVSCSTRKFQTQPSSCSSVADCPGSQLCTNGQCKSPTPQDCKFGEVRACYTGPKETQSVGICKPGTQTCGTDDKWGVCAGQTIPAKEVCGNNQDDDCDGKPDDQDPDCTECKAGDTRACYTGPKDTKDVGACKSGKQTCDDKKQWGPCEGEVLPKPKEVCGNLQDDDCNGKSDLEETACGDCQKGDKRECYEGPKDTKGVGICKAGTQECTDEQKWGPCKDQVKPLDNEVCGNGKDDDCSGKPDDGPCLQSCKSNSDCTSPLICFTPIGKLDGYCLKPCQNKSTCTPGQDCSPPGPGQPTYCLPVGNDKTCDPSLFVSCEASLFCDGSNKKCDTPKTPKEGESCNNFNQRCDAQHACVFMPLDGVCRKKCSQDSDCASGQTCARYTDVMGQISQVCLTRCSPGGTTGCTNTEECLPTASGGTTGYCSPIGTLGAWDRCQAGDKNCKKGLRCLLHPDTAQQRPIGYCVPIDCSKSTTPCPRVSGVAGNQAVCTQDSKTNLYNCVIPCKDNPNICNTGLQNFACRQIGQTPAYCTP